MATKKTKPAVRRTKPVLGKPPVPLKTVPGIVPAIRVPGVKPVPGIVPAVPFRVPGIVPSIVPKITPGIKPPAPGIVPLHVPVFPLHLPPGTKPPAPKYPAGEIVQINLSKYCAVELLNALIVALGIVPSGKKKKGKKP